MTIDEIMKYLNLLQSEINLMHHSFAEIEENADCDEPPKRMDNHKIKFVKNGKQYLCDIKSKVFCEISPDDLEPADKCFKQDFQNKLKIERNRLNFIVQKINELKSDSEKNEDFI